MIGDWSTQKDYVVTRQGLWRGRHTLRTYKWFLIDISSFIAIQKIDEEKQFKNQVYTRNRNLYIFVKIIFINPTLLWTCYWMWGLAVTYKTLTIRMNRYTNSYTRIKLILENSKRNNTKKFNNFTMYHHQQTCFCLDAFHIL